MPINMVQIIWSYQYGFILYGPFYMEKRLKYYGTRIVLAMDLLNELKSTYDKLRVLRVDRTSSGLF